MELIYRNWKKIKYIILGTHILGLLFAWYYHFYLILIINVIIEFLYMRINTMRKFASLSPERRSEYILMKIKSYVKESCLKNNIDDSLKHYRDKRNGRL